MNEDNKNKFQDSELEKLLKEYSVSDRSASSEGEKKKFVVHLDESLIDSDSSRSGDSHGTTGGIYFSNYAKHKPQPQQNRKPVQKSSAQGVKRTASATRNTVKKAGKTIAKKTQSIGGRAAAGFLAFILISTVVLSYIGLTCVGDMLAINRSTDNVEVVIPENRSYSDIIDILKENKLIKRKLFCKLFVKYRGFDDEEYLSGNYYLNRKMGVEGMLKDLMVAPVTADTITLSFPEGWTIQQIVEKLEKNEVCDSARLYAAIKSSTYDKYKFISDITDNKSRYLKLEGYLFPDTYDFYVGADANYVIKKFLDNFDKKWEDGYDARAEKLGCTRDQIITIASIIQKEAADADQMKLISSIIHNRLKDSANYPTLGCDSTAIYISNYVTPVVGENQGKLLYDFYDTSAVKGLPPGPICNPGMDAIKAALYPEDTNYYFFAHDKSGNIYTASTLNEHRNNLVKIIQANNKNR